MNPNQEITIYLTKCLQKLSALDNQHDEVCREVNELSIEDAHLAEHFARLVLADDGHAQLRLATPAVAARGDRVVLRDRTTIAGGTVLDPAPPRRLEPDRLALLEQGDPASIVLAALAASPEPLAKAELARRGLLSDEDLESGLQAAVDVGGYFLTEERLAEIRAASSAWSAASRICIAAAGAGAATAPIYIR